MSLGSDNDILINQHPLHRCASFETIIKDGTSVDHSPQISVFLSRAGIFNFIGRPRGFGKTLLLSFLSFYFLGRADLFEKLSIHDEVLKMKSEKRTFKVLSLDLSKVRRSADKQYEKLEEREMMRDVFHWLKNGS